MSSSADLVYRNFVWRLEALIPTNTSGITDKGFRFNGRRIEDAMIERLEANADILTVHLKPLGIEPVKRTPRRCGAPLILCLLITR